MEGLFSRAKRLMRVHRVKVPKGKNYGAYLAKFLWRQKHLQTVSLPDRHVRDYVFCLVSQSTAVFCFGLGASTKNK